MSTSRNRVSLLDAVSKCDDFPDHLCDDPDIYKVYFPGDCQAHGYMLPDIVERMPWTPDFSIQHEMPRRVTINDASNGIDTAEAVNDALQQVVNSCIEQDLFDVFCGKHSEYFTVVSANYSSPVRIERFAAQLFGFVQRGVHLFAFNKDDGMRVWVSKRSPDVFTYPSMLDVSAGGGLKHGASPLQTIVEEAMEEASLPENFVRENARSAGVISHMGVTGPEYSGEKGLILPDFIYVYDIEVPSHLTLRPHDDEVANFSLMPVPQLIEALQTQTFKPDSAASLVHFLIRHGHITPENEEDYVELSQRLHRRLPFRMRNI